MSTSLPKWLFIVSVFCLWLPSGTWLFVACRRRTEARYHYPRQLSKESSSINQDLHRPSHLLAAVLLSSPSVGWRVAGRSTTSRAFQSQRCSHVKATNNVWTAVEDAELLAQVPFFTVGEGSGAVTFWSVLAVSSRVLSIKSPEMCEERMSLLHKRSVTIPIDFGPQPAVLSHWKKVDYTHYAGILNGRNVWMTVDMEGRLGSDPRCEPAYIVAVGGGVFELGVPKEDQPRIAVTDRITKEIVNAPSLVSEPLQDDTRRNAIFRALLGYAWFGSGFLIGVARNAALAEQPSSLESPELPQTSPSNDASAVLRTVTQYDQHESA